MTALRHHLGDSNPANNSTCPDHGAYTGLLCPACTPTGADAVLEFATRLAGVAEKLGVPVSFTVAGKTIGGTP